MESKEKQTIVVDRVHSKRESPGEQPSETEADVCRQLSIVSQDAVEQVW